MTVSVFHALADAARRGESVALGIITAAQGSSPQKLGAKAIFFADRRIQGTLGGGCLEAEAQRLALRALTTGRAETLELVLDHDFGWDDGLICGGKVLGVIVPNAQRAGEAFWAELADRKCELAWGVKKDFSVAMLAERGSVTRSGAGMAEAVRVADPRSGRGPLEHWDWLYTETVTPPCALWIAGAGHIAQAVAPLALQLDFAVHIFDDRPELANHELFPQAVTLHVGPWGELCAASLSPGHTFGLIVTRGHKHDALVLESWVHRPFAFLGMIGSARKARTLSDHFISQKLATPEEMARVACPVGIRIRSQSVMEIAVDIMAQYIDRRAAALAGTQAASDGKTRLVEA